MNIQALSKYLKKIPNNIIYIILNYYGTNRNEYYIEKIDINKCIHMTSIPKIKKYSEDSYFVDLKKYRLSISIYDRRYDDYICYHLSAKEFNNNIKDNTTSLKFWDIYSDYYNGWIYEIED